MHPSHDIKGTKGKELEKQNIVLCITGSVAAVKCPELARELMRHGADVRACMTYNRQDRAHRAGAVGQPSASCPSYREHVGEDGARD
ncbi:MAG: hypothetical protein AVW05_01960 [Hadesarchaea archaeon DG-33]|nr:MAG: hypothetical protein AVW05_01960 [Hadesarchaea archaeon DG-33]